jgi:hypothetical protein
MTSSVAPAAEASNATFTPASKASISGPQLEHIDVEQTVTAEPGARTEAPESAASEETESLLSDDLQFAKHEFIVPLFIQGRQSEMYTQYITLKKDPVEQFLRDPHNVNPIAQVEEILYYLWTVETHIHLGLAEAEKEVLEGETSVT